MRLPHPLADARGSVLNFSRGFRERSPIRRFVLRPVPRLVLCKETLSLHSEAQVPQDWLRFRNQFDTKESVAFCKRCAEGPKEAGNGRVSKGKENENLDFRADNKLVIDGFDAFDLFG